MARAVGRSAGPASPTAATAVTAKALVADGYGDVALVLENKYHRFILSLICLYPHDRDHRQETLIMSFALLIEYGSSLKPVMIMKFLIVECCLSVPVLI